MCEFVAKLFDIIVSSACLIAPLLLQRCDYRLLLRESNKEPLKAPSRFFVLSVEKILPSKYSSYPLRRGSSDVRNQPV